MGVVRFVLRGIGVVFLLWLGLNLWFIFSPAFLPGPPAEPGTWAGVQQSLQGLAEAQRAGPEAEAAYRRQMDQSRPFDNALVIFYVIPVLLVRLFCGMARRRQISPLAIVATLAAFWFATALLVQVMGMVMGLILPNLGTIGRQAAVARLYVSNGDFWQIVILGVVMLLAMALRAPRFVFSKVFHAPRRIDRALAALLDEENGWLARNNGPDIARIGHWLVVVLLAGIGGWAVWRLCDGMDGGGLPDTLGLVARITAVAYAAYLLIRTHLQIVDYRTKPPEEFDPALRPQPAAHVAQTGKGGVIQDDSSSAFGWRRDR